MAQSIRLTLTPRVSKTVQVLEKKYPSLTKAEIFKLGISTLLSQTMSVTKFQKEMLEAEEELKEKLAQGNLNPKTTREFMKELKS